VTPRARSRGAATRSEHAHRRRRRPLRGGVQLTDATELERRRLERELKHGIERCLDALEHIAARPTRSLSQARSASGPRCGGSSPTRPGRTRRVPRALPGDPRPGRRGHSTQEKARAREQCPPRLVGTSDSAPAPGRPLPDRAERARPIRREPVKPARPARSPCQVVERGRDQHELVERDRRRQPHRVVPGRHRQAADQGLRDLRMWLVVAAGKVTCPPGPVPGSSRGDCGEPTTRQAFPSAKGRTPCTPPRPRDRDAGQGADQGVQRARRADQTSRLGVKTCPTPNRRFP
jgi:hypothetical protein